MASLRARLLAAVLVLGAVGLLLLGAVTYAEQRSFLLDRVDQQARSAPPAIAGALSGDGSGPAAGDRDHDHGGGPGGPDLRLPSGTYGEERNAAGKTVGSPIVFGYSQGVTADPKLPKDIPVGKPITVEGENGDSNHYRVLAQSNPFGGTIVVAIPMRDVDQTLHRLLAVEALVIAGVLLLLGAAAWATPRARSPEATSPTASSRPTRGPRSAASASR